MADRPSYRLTLKSEPGNTVPAGIRLRAALKCLLRAFGFRAVQVEEVPGDRPPEKREAPGPPWPTV